MAGNSETQDHQGLWKLTIHAKVIQGVDACYEEQGQLKENYK